MSKSKEEIPNGIKLPKGYTGTAERTQALEFETVNDTTGHRAKVRMLPGPARRVTARMSADSTSTLQSALNALEQGKQREAMKRGEDSRPLPGSPEKPN